MTDFKCIIMNFECFNNFKKFLMFYYILIRSCVLNIAFSLSKYWKLDFRKNDFFVAMLSSDEYTIHKWVLTSLFLNSVSKLSKRTFSCGNKYLVIFVNCFLEWLDHIYRRNVKNATSVMFCNLTSVIVFSVNWCTKQ